jgi:hypothetical protein
MAANSGALVGSQLLRGDDAPFYRRGFKVCVCLVSLGLLAAISQHLQYRLSNLRVQKHRNEGIENDIEASSKRRSAVKLYTI